MKKLLPSLALIAAFTSADAAIAWRTTPATISTDLGGTGLTGNPDNFIGFMVQLIDAGADGISNGINASSATGVSGDDTVVDVAWFGAGAFGATVGVLNSQSENGVANARYFVRAFNGPSRTAISGTSDNTSGLANGNEGAGIPNFDASGFVTGTTRPLRYGDSPVFAALSSTWNPAVDNVTFDFQIQTTLPVSVVPEPTTAGLMGMGMLGVIAALRKRKQRA